MTLRARTFAALYSALCAAAAVIGGAFAATLLWVLAACFLLVALLA